jgi:two-component system response regulator FixJ
MKKENLSVIIIDDDESICQSLKWLCESISLTVRTYNNPQHYLDTFDPRERGCLLVDVRMPFMSGLELIEAIKAKNSAIDVIVITAYGDIPMAVRSMKAGAVDFILKPFNEQVLLESIQQCLSKPKSLIIDDFWERFDELSAREKQVLQLILDGKLNKEIAFLLSIAISTVEAHRAKIMQKMKVKTLAELLKLCLQFDAFNSAAAMA